MRKLDRALAIEFIDLSIAEICPNDRAAKLARLDARPRDGPVVDGAAVFVAMWRVPPVRSPVAALTFLPPVPWLVERAYRLFLKLRPGLQAMARCGFARRAMGDG